MKSVNKNSRIGGFLEAATAFGLHNEIAGAELLLVGRPDFKSVRRH